MASAEAQNCHPNSLSIIHLRGVMAASPVPESPEKPPGRTLSSDLPHAQAPQLQLAIG